MKVSRLVLVVEGFLFSVSNSSFATTSITEETSFGSNPGGLRLFYYIPSFYDEGGPLVVVAHGCSQDAQNIADTSGWGELADEYGYALLLSQTGTAHSAVSHCFRTWMTDHQGRGASEPLSVKQMIDYMVSEFAVDEDQVFMTGLSAGGNLVNVMLATYPDVFAAGAPIAAYPYKCATDIDDVPYCAYGYVNYTPLVWGNLARSGYPGYSGSRPVVQIWHGSWDATINLANRYQQVKQWTNVHGIDANVDWYGSLLGYPHYLYKTWAGATRVETVTVTYMGHAIAVDPGASSWQCGATGTYAADFNICSAYWIGVFFGVVP